MKICLEVTDQLTGRDCVMNISMHDAQKLYTALREILGDAQYHAQPGQLVTVPDARVRV